MSSVKCSGGHASEYALIDFGARRKLERFGEWVVDRPSPAAEEVARALDERWREAVARYDRTDGDRGEWTPAGALPDHWTLSHGRLRFEIKPTEFGHLGIFPEQAENWDWIAERVESARRAIGRPPKVLNLFAYTGGSTLAAAAAGAEVVHIDAAQNTVAWARRNAELSGLADAPIRWIVEDALKFVRREQRRGNRYDAVILDPPTYGHGPAGEVWKLAESLGELLRLCSQLTAGNLQFMLLTCHSPGVGPNEARQLLQDALPDEKPEKISAAEMALTTAAGRRLPSGVAARVVDGRQ